MKVITYIVLLFSFSSQAEGATSFSRNCIAQLLGSAARNFKLQVCQDTKCHVAQVEQKLTEYTLSLKLLEFIETTDLSVTPKFKILKTVLQSREMREKHERRIMTQIQSFSGNYGAELLAAFNSFSAINEARNADAQPASPDSMETVQKESNNGETSWAIFEKFKKFVQAIPAFTPFQQKVIHALNVIERMIFLDVSPVYKSENLAFIGSNDGIIKYIHSQLAGDTFFLLDAIKFYALLKSIEGNDENLNNAKVWDQAHLNVWQIAMQATGQNKEKALRVMAVFGHDDMSNGYRVNDANAFSHFLKALQQLSPLPSSELYKPESLDGKNIIPPNMLTQFLALKATHIQLYGEKATADYLHEIFRAGNYHFIAGAFVATELIRNKVGTVARIRLPTFIAENLGYFYKKITMENVHMDEDAKKLYESGRISVIPAGWDNLRYKKARLNLELNLLILKLTKAQHRMGAEWAYELVARPRD